MFELGSNPDQLNGSASTKIIVSYEYVVRFFVVQFVGSSPVELQAHLDPGACQLISLTRYE